MDQKKIYILVGAFCLFAVIAAIFAEVSTHKKENNINNVSFNEGEIVDNNETTEKSQEEIKGDLNSYFTNKLTVNNYDTSKIKKINNDKDIVYSAYDIKDKTDNYDVDIHLPVINIQGVVPMEFNDITQSVFADKATEILTNKQQQNNIYTVNYSAYINNNVLSLIIKSTLKSGSDTQRTVIQTYNYNLETGEKLKIEDVLSIKNIIQSECRNKIKTTIERAKQEAEILIQAGYTVYNRDTTSQMYLLSNVNTFFVGKNSNLYIIFPYGNQNFTSEMDIVLYE